MTLVEGIDGVARLITRDVMGNYNHISIDFYFITNN